jgi:hypothetical protein
MGTTDSEVSLCKSSTTISCSLEETSILRRAFDEHIVKSRVEKFRQRTADLFAVVCLRVRFMGPESLMNNMRDSKLD